MDKLANTDQGVQPSSEDFAAFDRVMPHQYAFNCFWGYSLSKNSNIPTHSFLVPSLPMLTALSDACYMEASRSAPFFKKTCKMSEAQ